MGRIYDTQRWKRIRAMQLQAHPLCEDCALVNVVKPATDVDHRVAIKDGGAPFDFENLASRCHEHHSEKTAHVDGGFNNVRKTRAPIKGCDASGRPLDAAHWWNK